MWSSSFTDRLALGALLAALSSASLAGAAPLDAGGDGSRVSLSVTSLQAARFGATIRQSRDFSCGAAAVATLLTYHLENPTSEDDAFDFMWEHGDAEEIRAQGFSLLDIRGFLASRGYSADGFRISLGTLQEAGVPAIALITSEGYRHFVVVKGVREDHVVLGDPARGTRIVERAEFEASRDDVLFVVRSHTETSRAHFNEAVDWSRGPQAPLEQARRSRALALDRLLRPRLNEF